MYLEEITKKLKIINDLSGYEFYVLFGAADNIHQIQRFNKHGENDKIMDYEKIEDLLTEIEKIKNLAEKNIFNDWWFD